MWILTQAKILKADLINFDIISPKVHERFNVLIEIHNYLKTMAKKFAETISYVMVTQFFISSILLYIIGEYVIFSISALPSSC